MRFFIKLFFIFLVFLGLSYYYNIYTFENGVAKYLESNQDITSEELVEYFEEPEISFLKVPFSEKTYFGIIKGDGKTIIQKVQINDGFEANNKLSYIPLGIGVIAFFAILTNRKRYRD